MFSLNIVKILTKADKNNETIALYLFLVLTYNVSESIRTINPQYSFFFSIKNKFVLIHTINITPINETIMQ